MSNRSLAITTRIGCKNRCSYCPQDTLTKAYPRAGLSALMSYDVFCECIDKLPRDVAINFAGFTEPWLNPDCTKMLLYAHQRGHRIRVFTTTVGMQLQDVEQIKDVPFLQFVIHLPDADFSTKIRVDERYLSVFETLNTSGIRGLNHVYHPNGRGADDIHPRVRDLLHKHQPRIYRGDLITRANNVQIDGVRRVDFVSGKLAWCHRLYVNILLPNGDVALCCMDWGLKHILGNLRQDSYESLFTGDEFQRVVAGYSDEKIDIVCRNCDIARPATSQG